MPHVVFTKPRQEARAKENLERQGYGTFLPLCRKNKSSDPSPLFPRYLFFWVNGEMPWGPVQNTPGVSSVLRRTDFQLSFVSEKAIEAIKARMECDGGAVILEREPPQRVFKIGQRINITGGTHAGMNGLFVSKSKERITALLTMFGRQIKATVQEKNVA